MIYSGHIFMVFTPCLLTCTWVFLAIQLNSICFILKAMFNFETYFLAVWCITTLCVSLLQQTGLITFCCLRHLFPGLALLQPTMSAMPFIFFPKDAAKPRRWTNRVDIFPVRCCALQALLCYSADQLAPPAPRHHPTPNPPPAVDPRHISHVQVSSLSAVMTRANAPR